ncbi:hypothetical protein EYC98_21185 [Halieaceae bacterium IMCC14734]|uniref:Uncharacterized protein n=2 Tax=Candidatus Litorirhabdus singularis TaxID=2518993 RepID=A0ABT3TM28_9GAMM|nr:hypothetical protein [Candidatus Litorirhabdus singularis]
MTINHLTTLTLDYLEAEAGEVQRHQEALEQYLQHAGNSAQQIKFWMGFCINLDGDEDGDLRSVVATDVALAVMQGDVVVLGGC